MSRSLDFILHNPRHPFCRRLIVYYWRLFCSHIGVRRKPETVNIDEMMVSDSQWRTRLAMMRHYVFVCNVPHQFCGVGHLTSEWNAGFMLAKRFNLNFVHVPLPDPWENFLGWGKGELSYDSARKFKKIRLQLIPFKSNIDCIERLAYLISQYKLTTNTLFVLGDNQNAYDQTVSGEVLRQKYNDNLAWKHVKIHKKRGALTVAVHLRKGDILKTEKDTAKRYVDSAWMADMVSSVVRVLTCPVQVNVYSQGLTDEDKRAFSKLGAVDYFDNVDPCETFHNLLIADILVMSRSGFSYLAACMGRQLVIAPPKFWHCIPKGDRWIQIVDVPVLESKGAEVIKERFHIMRTQCESSDGVNKL